jgi:hypothetical protein
VKSFRAKPEPQLIGCYVVAAEQNELDVAFLALGGVGNIGCGCWDGDQGVRAAPMECEL